jgi:hypothetical protein
MKCADLELDLIHRVRRDQIYLRRVILVLKSQLLPYRTLEMNDKERHQSRAHLE